MENNKSFRIKYDENNLTDHLKIKINQNFDFLEVLSLKINQEDAYKLYSADYGVIVGRVLANDGFGIPNAKISVFIENPNVNNTSEESIVYPYTTIASKNSNDIRYNLLPSQQVGKCHQNVGTLPSKRSLLDNNVNISVFDNFYKYTTVSNESGDYMIFGVPVGNQQIHVDVDLSDIGVLSQAPRDMEYKGYSLKQFDSPNKFKKSTNLDSLSQIISENTTVYVYPFWGDEEEGEIAISKKNINLQYKFEPTCVFMGSIFSDSNKNGISKTCKPSKTAGKMSEMTTSQGTIEMIRKTIDGKIEYYDISGNRLINNDGVWCYQIPMNLDYVITDEYGNIQPTTDPSRGIPTRSEVRFRISLDDNGGEFVQNKTGSYLVPNNPTGETEEDYEFGQACKSTSFVSLMWNKVYSVKNYIPRVQKIGLGLLPGRGLEAKNRKFIGIKSINYHESNNPAPYNNLYVNITLKFMLLCLITKLLINAVRTINGIIAWIKQKLGISINQICINTKMLGDCDTISEITSMDYYVPCNQYTQSKVVNNTRNLYPIGTRFAYEGVDSIYGSTYYVDKILSCIETSLASENEVVNFDFTNDWLNGSLYAPRFLTKAKKNKKSGKVILKYCGSYAINTYPNLHILQTCAVGIDNYGILDSKTVAECKDNGKCYKKNTKIDIERGLLKLGSDDKIYYYRASEFFTNIINKYLHPTDIILLGSMSDCDQDGIPQLHQMLPSTTFKTPPDSVEYGEAAGWTGETVYEYTYLQPTHNYPDLEELNNAALSEKLDGHLYIVDTNPYNYKIVDNKPVFTGTAPGSYYYYSDGTFHVTGDTFISGYTETINNVTTYYHRMSFTSGHSESRNVWVITGETTPDMSGIDWGNAADNFDKTIHYQNGLFVGVNCIDSDTYTKSCVNVARLCELGVDLDEREEYEDGILAVTTEVDGFINSNEISDGDARAMFATLNINNLKTKLVNNQTKYDFLYTYPDGFDGRLYTLTADTMSPDYMKFRFGDRYGYDEAYRNSMYYSYTLDGETYTFPKYENSFYFYFGLRPGYTALDVFNTNYFVKCESTKKDAFLVSLAIESAEGICQGNDGSIKLTLEDVLFPCKVYVNNEKILDNLTESEIIFEKLTSQYYIFKVYDANDDLVSNSIFLPKKIGINFDYVIKPMGDLTYGTISITNITNGNSDVISYVVKVIKESDSSYTETTITSSSYNITSLPGGFNYTVSILETGCENNIKTITGLFIPSVPILQISSNLNTFGANYIDINAVTIINNGGSNIISKGLCWSKKSVSLLPTINNSFKVITTGANTFSGRIDGLESGVEYMVRGYAENINGTGYTTALLFTTDSSLPKVTTSPVTGIYSDSAILGGYNVSSNGNAITGYGVVCGNNAGITADLKDSITATYDVGNALLYTTVPIYDTTVTNTSITGPDNNEAYVIAGITTDVKFVVDLSFRMKITLATPLVASEHILIDRFDQVMIKHPFYSGNSTDVKTPLSSGFYVYFNDLSTGYVVNGSTSTEPYVFNIALEKSKVKFLLNQSIYFGVLSVTEEFMTHPLDDLTGARELFYKVTDVIIEPIANYEANSCRFIVGDTFISNNLNSGVFTVSATALDPNTTYEAEAYVTNSIGTAWGGIQSFTTPSDSTSFHVTLSINQKESILPGSDGKINVSITGNITNPYKVELNGSSALPYLTGLTSSSVICTGLTAGDYAIKVIDADNVSDTHSITLVKKWGISLSIAESESNINAYDGKIKVNIIGLIDNPYKVHLDSELTLTGQTATEVFLTGLTAGTYDVVVTDVNNIVLSASIVLEVRASLINFKYVLGETHSNESSYADGTIYLYDISGATNYTYIVDGYNNYGGESGVEFISHSKNGTFTGATFNITGLTGGYYQVWVSETNYPSNKKQVTNLTILSPPYLGISDYTTSSTTTNSITINNVNITSSGGDNADSAGLCWVVESGGSIPTVIDNTTFIYPSISFSGEITSLEPGITYAIRGNATNKYGTGYTQKIFNIKTNSTAPTLRTSMPIDTTTTTATLGGYDVKPNGDDIIGRGVICGRSDLKINLYLRSGLGQILMFPAARIVSIYSVEVVGDTNTIVSYDGVDYERFIITGVTEEVAFNLSCKIKIEVSTTTAPSGDEFIELSLYNNASAIFAIDHSFYTGHLPIYLLDVDVYSLYLYFPAHSSIGYIVRGMTTEPYQFSVNVNLLQEHFILNQPIYFGTASVSQDFMDSPVGTFNGQIDYINFAVSDYVQQEFVIGNTYTGSTITNGEFTANAINLTPHKTYYAQAYADNSIGRGWGERLLFTAKVVKFSVAPSIEQKVTIGAGRSDGKVKVSVSSGIKKPYGVQLNGVSTPYLTGLMDNSVICTGLTSQNYIIKVIDNDIPPDYESCELYLPTNSGITFTCTTTGSYNNQTPDGIIHISGITNGNSTITAYTYTIHGYLAGSQPHYVFYDATGTTTSTSVNIGPISGGTYTIKVYETANMENFRETSNIRVASPPFINITNILTGVTKNAITISNVEITDSGGASISAEGLCWSEGYVTPTMNDTIAPVSPLSLTFGKSITGLTSLTQYSIRAYATNIYGTSFNNSVMRFTTLASGPTITTTIPSNSDISTTTATLGAYNVSDNNSTITAYGVTCERSGFTVNVNFRNGLEVNQGDYDTPIYDVTTGGDDSVITSTTPIGKYIITGITEEVNYSHSYKLKISVLGDNDFTSESELYIPMLNYYTDVFEIKHPFYLGDSPIYPLAEGNGFSSFYIYFPANSTLGYIVSGDTSTTAYEFSISLILSQAQLLLNDPVYFGTINISAAFMTTPIGTGGISVVRFELVQDTYIVSDFKIGDTYIGDTFPVGTSFSLLASNLCPDKNYQINSYATNINDTEWGGIVGFRTKT